MNEVIKDLTRKIHPGSWDGWAAAGMVAAGAVWAAVRYSHRQAYLRGRADAQQARRDADIAAIWDELKAIRASISSVHERVDRLWERINQGWGPRVE